MTAGEREEAMAAVRGGRPAAAGEGRPMTRHELQLLAASDLVDIGAHTRTHPNLTKLSYEVVLDELRGSRADLAEWLGSPPETVSYPFGLHGPRVRHAAKRAGFRLAAGTHAMPVTRLAGRFELGRRWVSNRSADWLERRVARLVGRGRARVASLTALGNDFLAESASIVESLAPASTVLGSAPLG